MRVLSIFTLFLAAAISCTKPDLPDVQQKDDKSKIEIEQPGRQDPGEGNKTGSDISSMKVSISAGGKTVAATLVNNAATDKLREILSAGPLSYTSTENGFETYGDIGQALPTSNESINASCGDILLYASRYICIFWGTNTYSYTRLGRIEGMSADEIKGMFKGDAIIEIRLSN